MISNKAYLFLILSIHVNILFSQARISFTTAEQLWINNHPTVQYGYENSWPPFEIYNDGSYMGISGDYIKLIEQYTGIDMQPIPNITWEESLNGLKNGDINVVALAGITESRSQYLDFTSPHIKDPLVIITRNNYPFVNSLEDFNGKIICVPKGYYTEDLISKDFPKINLQREPSVKECLLAVSTGKVDAYVGSLSVVTYQINMNGFANLKVASPTAYKISEFAFAVTKDWSIFRDIVDKVFAAVPQEEKMAIFTKWVNPVKNDHLIDLGKLTNYLVYTGLIFLFIITLFTLWNRSLQKEITMRNKVQEELRLSFDLIQDKNTENKALLKENHHRVKNNLQMMHSMLNMQARKINDSSSKKALLDANSRVMAMSLIQKTLFKIENFGYVNLKVYINLLLENIKKLYGFNTENITIHLAIDNITLNVDDVNPLGLILNELVVNSFKHAFLENEVGAIHIILREQEDQYYFKYEDSGQSHNTTDIEKRNSFGLFLIKSLIAQLVANNIVSGKHNYSISFNFKGTKV